MCVFGEGESVQVVCVGECGLSGWIFFEGDTNVNTHKL